MLSWSNWNNCAEDWRAPRIGLTFGAGVAFDSSECESESFVAETAVDDCSFLGALPRFLCCRAYLQSY